LDRRERRNKRMKILHDEELYNLYSAPNIMLIKSRKKYSAVAADEKCI
jgi:hypothetical protein